MDPLSMLILLGIVTVTASRTVGSAVTDSIAQAKGHTPPSLEKWRSNQKTKEARGEKRAATEPSPWRRRWNNSIEYRNAKAAQKHQADMEHLRDHGGENVAQRKAKLERRTRRRDALNTRVAGWGASSWEAAKQAAENAKNTHHERKTEKQAWRENNRRDSADPTPVNRDNTAAPAETATPTPGSGDATVLPFHRPESDEAALVARWRDAVASGESNPDVLTAEEWNSLPSATRDKLIAETQKAGFTPGEHRPDGTWSPLPTTSATPQNETHNSDGGTDMSTTNTSTTEITDLDTAITFTQETAKYTDTVSAVLSDILAQLDAATSGLNAEAGQYEQGKASLSEEGFGSKVTGRFDSGSEALNAAAEALKTVAMTVTEATEQVGTAGGEMRGAAKTFSDQLALQEQIGAAAQDAGVSKRTDFYAPA